MSVKKTVQTERIRIEACRAFDQFLILVEILRVSLKTRAAPSQNKALAKKAALSHMRWAFLYDEAITHGVDERWLGVGAGQGTAKPWVSGKDVNDPAKYDFIRDRLTEQILAHITNEEWPDYMYDWLDKAKTS